MVKHWFRKIVPKCSIESTFTKLEGKVICFDAYPWIYSNMRKPNHYLVAWVSFIDLLINKLKIKPIFVFDGAPPKEKIKELKKRKLKREKAINLVNENKQKLINAQNSQEDCLSEIKTAKEQINKFQKRSYKITKDVIDKIKLLFDLLKVSYIHIENKEADLICAVLVKLDICYACVSNDYDMFSYGCTRIIRNFNLKTKRFDIIYADYISSILKLNNHSILDVSMLSGNCYLKIKHSKTLEEIITILNGETNIVDVVSKFDINYEEYVKIKGIYNFDITKTDIELLIVNYKNLQNITRNIKQETIDMFINQYVNLYNKTDNSNVNKLCFLISNLEILKSGPSHKDYSDFVKKVKSQELIFKKVLNNYFRYWTKNTSFIC